MTTAVAVISTVCILLVLGYRFDFKSGDVEQGALIQLRSFPSGATITLDKEVLPFVTPGKRNVDVGNHAVTMKLDGYESWEKSFSVDASELRWLNYARLIPETLQTNPVKEFPVLAEALPSPDKKWFLLLPAADKPEFTLVDLRNEKEPTFSQLILPETSYTQRADVPHLFSIVEWDFGAKYALIKHTAGDITEYIRLDRTDADNAINISSKLGVVPDDIHFSGTSGNIYYALERGLLRRLDTNGGTISEPIVKDVASFKIYKTNTLAYIKQAIDNKIGVGVVVNGKPNRVVTYDATQPVFTDINEYFNDHYLAVGRGTTLEIFKDPELDTRRKLTSQSTASAINWMRFGSNGRFLTAGTGSQFTTYDLELATKSNINLPGTMTDPAKPLQWLDDYYLVSSADNDLRLTEFDGGNQHVITSALPGFSVTLNENGRVLYSFSKAQNGTILMQSTRMVIER